MNTKPLLKNCLRFIRKHWSNKRSVSSFRLELMLSGCWMLALAEDRHWKNIPASSSRSFGKTRGYLQHEREENEIFTCSEEIPQDTFIQICLNKTGSICLKSCLISCPHSSRRNLAGQAVMLKKLNFTFPYLDAKVPVSKEWKIIIVSSKSHTNTRCDDRWGGKKKHSYILSNCKNRFSQEICPVGLEIFKISSHLEHWLWMFCESRQNETSGILELRVCWPFHEPALLTTTEIPCCLSSQGNKTSDLQKAQRKKKKRYIWRIVRDVDNTGIEQLFWLLVSAGSSCVTNSVLSLGFANTGNCSSLLDLLKE